MAKDVKIEVLYYKTATDISLEFGLHGNYPLRLLSSNCNDIDTFFRALKRAVSRSEIIITVGGYDGSDYLPRFIARAIGKGCVTPDYRGNGIIAESKYAIPESAAPLAPDSKRFGGFLIESGPQTIISLTDDRKIRLEVAKQFLVNYITEHHNVFNTPFAVPSGSAAPSSEPEVTEFSDISSDSAVNGTAEAPTEPEPQNEPAVPFDAPPELLPETVLPIVRPTDGIELLSGDLSTEPTVTEDSSTERIATEDTLDVELDLNIDDQPDDGEEQSELHVFENYETERFSSRRRKRVVRLLCLVLSILVVLSMCACLLLFGGSRPTNSNTDYYSYISNLYSSADNDPVSAFEKIHKENSDFTAWLDFEQGGIFHPILAVDDPTDSTEHLTTLPNGLTHTAGSLVTRRVSGSLITSATAAVYGSAAKGGILEKIATSDGNSLVNSRLSLSDDHYASEWTVFSVFSNSEASDFNGVVTDFDSVDSKRTYIESLKNASTVKSDIEPVGNEPLLILVGANGEENYIVAALLSSVQVLSGSKPVTENTSSASSSVDTDSSTESQESHPEGEDDTGEAGQTPDTPDIVLPPLPPFEATSSEISSTEPSETTSSENTSSKQSSVNTSSSTSTDTSSSAVSSDNSSFQSSSESVSSTVSSETSSVTSSTNSSSTVTSSSASSAVTSSTPTQTVDPRYTWDITLYVKDKKTGTPYSGNAVDIVAMIIEIEMSPTIDPKEAVKAQAVAAYNWLLNNGATKQSTAPSVSLDPNTTAQAKQYAAEAKGMLVLYGNTVAKTNYYAYSAGKTANTQDIWGGTAYPYLQSVDCSVDKDLKDFETTKTYTSDEIKKLIKEKCGIDVSGMAKTDWIKPIEYDENGLYCLTVSIGGKEYRGKYVRETLLSYGIRSSAYTVTYDETTDKFTFTVKGYGHGVGMSQRGAKAYAKLGWTCEQILTHFFPQTTVVKY